MLRSCTDTKLFNLDFNEVLFLPNLLGKKRSLRKKFAKNKSFMKDLPKTKYYKIPKM